MAVDLMVEDTRGRRLRVDSYIWRSYTGRRFIVTSSGCRERVREAHGPVFGLGTNEVSKSVRACACVNCHTDEGWRLS